MTLDSSAHGEGHSQTSESGSLPEFKAMLVLSTGLENSSHEEIEDLGRVNPILGLKKKALQCEDVVEPEFFFYSSSFST